MTGDRAYDGSKGRRRRSGAERSWLVPPSSALRSTFGQIALRSHRCQKSYHGQEYPARGVTKGLVSVQWRGDYPQNIWSVYSVGDDTWVIEAQLENQVQGVYHAYPLPENDPFRLIVLKRWHEEIEHGT